jgi:hypothetical protein
MFNKKIDFIHNFYGFIFCIQAIYLIFNGYIQNQNNIVVLNKLTTYGTTYFIISSVINIMDKNYIFVIHHLICIITTWYGYLYKNPLYIKWLISSYLAEFSTIFLSFSKILRYLKNDKKIYINNSLISTSDNLFVLTYYIFRIIYICPITIYFVYTNNFHGIFNFIIPCCIWIMIGMNYYWAYLLFFKVLNKINNVKDTNKN